MLLAPLGLYAVVAGPAPAVTQVQAAQASVVLVRAHLGEGIYGRQGSGVVVAPGLVATNAHVVEGGHHLRVSRGPDSWAVTQVRMDEARDLCLLTVPGLPLPPALPALDSPQVGQVVYSVGFPEGRGPVVAQGRLLGVWAYGEARLLQGDAATHPGSSGGGLFDSEGRLLGLTTFTFFENSRLNFSVPLSWVDELAQRSPDPDSVGPPSPWAHGQEGRAAADFLTLLVEDPRNWPAWEAASRAWTTTHPTDPDAWMALGLALDRLARQDAEAGRGAPVASLNEAVQAFERSVSLRRTSLRPQALGWNALGAALDLVNRFAEAEQAFLQAVRLDASYSRAWLNLGVSRINAHRFREAAAALAKGLALEPDNGPGWARYAYALAHAHAPGAAVEAYVIALRYRPLAAELWLDLGLLLVDLGRPDEARGVQTRLASLNPELAARLQATLRRSRPARSPAGAGARRRGR